MAAFITILSYLAIMLLSMLVEKARILETFILIIAGIGLLILKKPWKQRKTISKISCLIAGICSVYFGICFYNRWTFRSTATSVISILNISFEMFQWIVLAAAICGSLFAVYFLAGLIQQLKNQMCLKEEKRLFAKDLWNCFVVAGVLVMLAQIMCDTYVLSMGYAQFAIGILLAASMILLIYCLIGKSHWAVLVGSFPWMLLFTVNAYVYSFRSRLLEPVDVFSIGTAMNVVDNYSLFPVPAAILVSWGIWLGMMVMVFWNRSKKKGNLPGKKRLLLATGSIVAVIGVFFYASSVKTEHWQNNGAKKYGYIFDFVSKFKEIRIAEPDGYDKEQIATLAEKYQLAKETEEKKPHIIVIMNEAFSDLGVHGDIKTNTEVMPFVSSMGENAVSGYALASVYGGNTANSEFEFLTGNTMAWLSPNMVPYQRYVQPSAYSMVSYLKSTYQYQCIAMHPYLSSSWNRPTAYANLGFDEAMFLEDFKQEQYVRQYVSDQEMFEMVVETYESKKDQPLFLFGVSMQNHGGYNYKGANFEQSVSLEGFDGDYPEVEQYLSLIRETDRAVEYLISYFQQVDDDVVIVFFGDHQPILDDAFYNEIQENSDDSLDEQQKKYMVPFFVWTNYDSEEKEVTCTSLNYLSSYVYEVAGLAKPPYNQFLSEMEGNIPAINASGFYSKEQQQYLPFEQASKEEKQWLQQYQNLQYHNLFEEKDRYNSLFPGSE